MKQKGRVQMKIKDIVRDYNLDKEAFEAFLQDQGIAVKFSLTGAYLEDSVDLVQLLDQFQNYMADQDEEFAEQLAQQKEREQGIANIVVTTGQGFDGYSITHYGGPVASDLAHSIARGMDGGRGDHALGDPAQSLVDVMGRFKGFYLCEFFRRAQIVQGNCQQCEENDVFNRSQARVQQVRHGNLFHAQFFGDTVGQLLQ